MRGKVPEDVHVRLDEAKVDPDGVDEQDFAQGAVGDQFPDLQDGRGVAVRVVRHQDQAAALGFRDHFQALGPGVRERLFNQDVLSGTQCREGDAVVGVGRCRDGDGVDVDRVQELLDGPADGDVSVRCGEFGGPGAVHVHDGRQLPVGAALKLRARLGPQ